MLFLQLAIILLIVIAGLWKIKNTLKQLAGEDAEDLFQSTVTLLNSYLETKPLVVITVLINCRFWC